MKSLSIRTGKGQKSISEDKVIIIATAVFQDVFFNCLQMNMPYTDLYFSSKPTVKLDGMKYS